MLTRDGSLDEAPAVARQDLQGEGEEVGVLDLGVVRKVEQELPQMLGPRGNGRIREAGAQTTMVRQELIDLASRFAGQCELAEEADLFRFRVSAEQQLG